MGKRLECRISLLVTANCLVLKCVVRENLWRIDGYRRQSDCVSSPFADDEISNEADDEEESSEEPFEGNLDQNQTISYLQRHDENVLSSTLHLYNAIGRINASGYIEKKKLIFEKKKKQIL